MDIEPLLTNFISSTPLIRAGEDAFVAQLGANTTANTRQNLAKQLSFWNNIIFSVPSQRTAQRLALPAGGRDETTPL